MMAFVIVDNTIETCKTGQRDCSSNIFLLLDLKIKAYFLL